MTYYNIFYMGLSRGESLYDNVINCGDVNYQDVKNYQDVISIIDICKYSLSTSIRMGFCPLPKT